MIDFKELQEILYNISEKSAVALIKQFEIPIKTVGHKKLYDVEKVKYIKTIMDENYEYNKAHYLLKSHVKEYNLPKYLLLEASKVKCTPLDKIKEFRGGIEFYKKEEIIKIAKEYWEFKNSISLREAQKILYKFHFLQLYETLDYFNVNVVTKDQHKRYKKEEIEYIKSEIENRYKYNRQQYYSYDEALTLGCTSHRLKLTENYEMLTFERVHDFKGSKSLYKKQDIDEIVNNNLRKSETYTSQEVADMLNLSPNRSNIHLRESGFSPLNLGNSLSLLWDKDLIDQYLAEIRELYNTYDENYITEKELFSQLGIHKQRMELLAERYKITVPYHKIPKNIKINRFYRTDKAILLYDVLKILSITLNDLSDLQKAKALKFIKTYEKKSLITTHSLKTQKVKSKNTKILKYINSHPDINYEYKELVFDLDNYYLTNGPIHKLLISETDVTSSYKISPTNFRKYFRNKLISPAFKYKGTYFYDLNEITLLFNDLINQQNELSDKYITSMEINSLGVSRHSCKNIAIQKRLPYILNFGSLNQKYTILYNRKAFNNLLIDHQKNLILEKYKQLLEKTNNPGEILLKCIEELKQKVDYCIEQDKFPETSSYWLKYIVEKINKSRGNINSLKSLMIRLINYTEIFNDIKIEKEIMKYSTNSINLLLNSNVNVYFRLEMHHFLNYINDKTTVDYNASNLIDVYKLVEEQRTSREREIYNIDLFIDLIDYCSDLDVHLNEAIKNFSEPTHNNLKYNEYASTWLYILIHFNNAWRSNDIVTKVPRISLPETIKSIEDLNSYKLTNSEIDSIVWELASKIIGTQHNKNSKLAYYFFSQELKKPLAYAALICELKCKIERPFKNQLIKLSGDNTLTTALNNRFFKHFKIKGFKFKSLAANRSFITLVTAVLNKTINRNPLELTKLLRNHSTEDMTNEYIHISQEHINLMVKQLFDIGHFGYNYRLLLDSVLTDVETNNIDTHKKIKLVKQIFGDTYKIENLANQLAELNSETPEIYNYLELLSLEERAEKLFLISLNQLPAKQKFWQCIFGTCIYPNRDCESCPFSIPHIYSLTSITENLNKFINSYNTESILGEKKRLTNLIYKNLILLKEAKETFGEHVLEAFLGYDYVILLEKISNLDDFYEYLTIERINQ